MSILKFALVGCGRIANRHADLLGNNIIENAELAAVCDLDENKANKIAKKFNVNAYIDMHEMMRKEKIDVISVLTESGNHASNVIDLAKYKKHIIVEKPISLTLEDADKMIAAADNANIKLFVVKQNRFNLPIIKLREAIENKRFGKLLLGTVRVRWCRTQQYYDQASWRGTWSMDGGVLTNQAIHHVDMLSWMMGDIESVFSYSVTHLAEIEAEDTIVSSIRFKNGALGTIEATTAARPKDLEGSISILGEKGTVEIGGFAMNQIKTWEFSESLSEDENIISQYSSNPPNVYGYGHKAYYDHVIKSITKGSPNLIDGIQAKKSIEIVSAIYDSVESKKEVQIGSYSNRLKLGKN